MEILKEIFDNKLVKIITLFVDNPDKKYSLSEIAELSKINITTSYRILNQLISKKIVKLVRIGKAKLYELEKNEKTLELLRILDTNTKPIEEFTISLSRIKGIKKIILDSRIKDNAKVIVITESNQSEKIKEIVKDIKVKYKYDINYLEILEEKEEEYKNFTDKDLEENVIWKDNTKKN